MTEGVSLGGLIKLSESDVEHAVSDHAATHGGKGLAGFVTSVGADELNSALDKDAGDVLALGWTKVQAVREAAKKSLGHSGETVVMLGEHDLTSTHYPVLTITVAKLPATELKFTLELIARFKSVKLAIREGRIRSFSPGEVSAIVRLKYKGTQLKEQSTPAWNLPGKVDLPGEGIVVAH
jgi:hypothetical protein